MENEKGTLLLTNDVIPFPTTFENNTTFFNDISSKKEEVFWGIFYLAYFFKNAEDIPPCNSLYVQIINHTKEKTTQGTFLQLEPL